MFVQPDIVTGIRITVTRDIQTGHFLLADMQTLQIIFPDAYFVFSGQDFFENIKSVEFGLNFLDYTVIADIDQLHSNSSEGPSITTFIHQIDRAIDLTFADRSAAWGFAA